MTAAKDVCRVCGGKREVGSGRRMCSACWREVPLSARVDFLHIKESSRAFGLMVELVRKRRRRDL